MFIYIYIYIYICILSVCISMYSYASITHPYTPIPCHTPPYGCITHMNSSIQQKLPQKSQNQDRDTQNHICVQESKTGPYPTQYPNLANKLTKP